MADYQTRKQMEDQILEQTGDRSTSAGLTLARNTLNRAYENVAAQERWPQLIRASEQVVTYTAGGKFLYLPKSFEGTPLFIYPDNEPGTIAAIGLERAFHEYNVSANTSSEAQNWAEAGVQGKKTDWHSAAELLTITPGSGETANGTYFVHGISGGEEIQETVTTVTTTPADTSNSYTDLIAVSSDGSHTKTVTITGKTSSREYATLAPNERTAKYRVLRLFRIPPNATQLTMYYKKTVRPLLNDNAVPEIPVSTYLVEKTIADLLRRDRRNDEAQDWEGQSNATLRRVIAREMHHGEKFRQAVPRMPVANRSRRTIIVKSSL